MYRTVPPKHISVNCLIPLISLAKQNPAPRLSLRRLKKFRDAALCPAPPTFDLNVQDAPYLHLRPAPLRRYRPSGMFCSAFARFCFPPGPASRAQLHAVAGPSRPQPRPETIFCFWLKVWATYSCCIAHPTFSVMPRHRSQLTRRTPPGHTPHLAVDPRPPASRTPHLQPRFCPLLPQAVGNFRPAPGR